MFWLSCSSFSCFFFILLPSSYCSFQHGHSHDEEEGHSHAKKSKKKHDHDHDHDHHDHDHDHDHDHHHDHGHDHGHEHKEKKEKKDKTKKKEKKHHDHHDHHGHSHGDENLMGVYLHVLADTLGSVGVIVSSSLVHYMGKLRNIFRTQKAEYILVLSRLDNRGSDCEFLYFDYDFPICCSSSSQLRSHSSSM